jgi:hypothetical protein
MVWFIYDALVFTAAIFAGIIVFRVRAPDDFSQHDTIADKVADRRANVPRGIQVPADLR